jgi:hypothetical protein
MIRKKNQKFKVWKEKDRNEYGNIQAWVFDASEVKNDSFPVPDFTPDWLYDILENIEKSSGGYYGECMESFFEMDDTYYNTLIKHPNCESYKEVNTL